MKDMAISYKETGRTAQKARTRTALVEAARGLLAEGTMPTVEEAAVAASVSRATAYRYFSSPYELLVAAHPEVDTASLIADDAPAEPEARLDRVVVALSEMFLGAEESYRAMLRLSLEPMADRRRELALRKGRRFLWIEDALEPLRDRLEGARYERLVHALSAAVGIEALVTLIDLGGLSREEAVEVMRWSARGLLGAALAESELPATAARSRMPTGSA